MRNMTNTADSNELSESSKMLSTTIQEVLRAIEECLIADRWHPALILVFVTMDSMAWLERDDTSPDVRPSDFIAWADRYLLPGSELPCSAEELYSARCGMLHSLTADSRRQRNNRSTVRRVFYYRERAEESESVDALLSTMFAEPVVPVYVNIDQLFWALKRGLALFSEALEADDAKLGRASKRVRGSYLQRGTLR